MKRLALILFGLGLAGFLSQTQLAIDFYRAVFGLNDPGVSLYACGAQPGILTGHSLSGGLAA